MTTPASKLDLHHTSSECAENQFVDNLVSRLLLEDDNCSSLGNNGCDRSQSQPYSTHREHEQESLPAYDYNTVTKMDMAGPIGYKSNEGPGQPYSTTLWHYPTGEALNKQDTKGESWNYQDGIQTMNSFVRTNGKIPYTVKYPQVALFPHRGDHSTANKIIPNHGVIGDIVGNFLSIPQMTKSSEQAMAKIDQTGGINLKLSESGKESKMQQAVEDNSGNTGRPIIGAKHSLRKELLLKELKQPNLLENESLFDPASPTLSTASSGESQWQKSDSGFESLSLSPPTPPETSLDPNPVDDFLKHLGTLPMDQVLFKIGRILESQKMDPPLLERMLNNKSTLPSDKTATNQPWSNVEPDTNVINDNQTKEQFKGAQYFQYPEQQTGSPTSKSVDRYISTASFSSASGSNSSLSAPMENQLVDTKQNDIFSSYPRHIYSQLPPNLPSNEFLFDSANLPPPEYLKNMPPPIAITSATPYMPETVDPALADQSRFQNALLYSQPSVPNLAYPKYCPNYNQLTAYQNQPHTVPQNMKIHTESRALINHRNINAVHHKWDSANINATRQGSVIPRSGATYELHLRLEECFEQLKQLEKERRRTDIEIERFFPGRKLTNLNNVPMPQLPLNPSRVDHLIIGEFREHARILSICGKMESLQKGKLFENRIAEALTGWVEAIRNVEINRKDEMTTPTGKNAMTMLANEHLARRLPASSTAGRYEVGGMPLLPLPTQQSSGVSQCHQSSKVDQELLRMAESISKLSVASRRMRTALWTSLQTTVLFNQDSSNFAPNFPITVGK